VQFSGLVRPGVSKRTPIGIQAWSVGGRVDNSKTIIFRQECVLKQRARLDVVDSLDIRNIGANTGIGQSAILANRLELKVWLKSAKGLPLGS